MTCEMASSHKHCLLSPHSLALALSPLATLLYTLLSLQRRRQLAAIRLELFKVDHIVVLGVMLFKNVIYFFVIYFTPIL